MFAKDYTPVGVVNFAPSQSSGFQGFSQPAFAMNANKPMLPSTLQVTNNFIYVTAPQRNEIRQYTHDGQLSSVIGVNKSPHGMLGHVMSSGSYSNAILCAVDDQGSILFLERLTTRLCSLTPTGGLRRQIQVSAADAQRMTCSQWMDAVVLGRSVFVLGKHPQMNAFSLYRLSLP